MDKELKIVADGDAILLPEYFDHFGLFYSMLNISYRGLGSVFFLTSWVLGASKHDVSFKLIWQLNSSCS